MDDNEKTLVLDKTYTCPVCDKKIKVKSVKSNVAKFVGTGPDLRPIHSNINVTKYEIASCNYCGYTALVKDFPNTTQTQRKLLREKIQANFKSHEEIPCETISVETAISRLKMALLCTVSKLGKEGEIGNICLKISWLYQDFVDELSEDDSTYEEKKAAYLAEAHNQAMNAYEHLSKARMEEDYPIAGMNEPTLDYLLSYLAYEKGEYQTAMQYLSGVVSTRGITPRLKDKCLQLKELIAPKLHEKDGGNAESESES